MKKKKLIIVLSSLIILFLGCVVFAAFMITKVITGTATTGTVTLESKYFLNYSPQNLDPSASNYLEALKNRVEVPIKQEAQGSNSITCYGTEKKGYSDEENYFYLNQLGFEFSFSNTIDVYVRIHFQDSWISRKVYNNGNIVENYITKDKIEGDSPFEITGTDWVYDEATNCAYLKNKVLASTEINTFSFDVNKNYWYVSDQTIKSYREQILIQTSFIVDVVQCNRAAQKWDVNLDDILGGN